jgi:hypothetical protein
VELARAMARYNLSSLEDAKKVATIEKRWEDEFFWGCGESEIKRFFEIKESNLDVQGPGLGFDDKDDFDILNLVKAEKKGRREGKEYAQRIVMNKLVDALRNQKDRDMEVVCNLVEKIGIDVNTLNNYGNPLIFSACFDYVFQKNNLRQNNLSMIQYLLKKGANPNNEIQAEYEWDKRINWLNTVFFVCELGDLDVVKIVVEGGKYVRIKAAHVVSSGKNKHSGVKEYLLKVRQQQKRLRGELEKYGVIEPFDDEVKKFVALQRHNYSPHVNRGFLPLGAVKLLNLARKGKQQAIIRLIAQSGMQTGLVRGCPPNVQLKKYLLNAREQQKEEAQKN